MLGKESRLNPLESQKQLLIAESELNRVQLLEEWQAMTDGVQNLTDRVKSVGSLASVGALLFAGMSAFRRGKSVVTGVKPSWFQSALKVTKVVGSIWLAFRARK